MSRLPITRRGFFTFGSVLATAPALAANESSAIFECYVTGQLNADYVSVSENHVPLLAAFVSTSPILGVALSFRLKQSTKDTLLTVAVGIDPDNKTIVSHLCDPSKGHYLMITYQRKNRLKITQSKIKPLFQ